MWTEVWTSWWLFLDAHQIWLKFNKGWGACYWFKSTNSDFLCVIRFTGFGGPVPHRPVEDLAFAVAKFIQKGGSYINYYMVRTHIISPVWLWCYVVNPWAQVWHDTYSSFRILVPWWHEFWQDGWWSFHCYKLWLWCSDWWIWSVNISVLSLTCSISICLVFQFLYWLLVFFFLGHSLVIFKSWCLAL